MTTIAVLSTSVVAETDDFDVKMKGVSSGTKRMAADMRANGGAMAKFNAGMTELGTRTGISGKTLMALINPITLVGVAILGTALSVSKLSQEMAITSDQTVKFSRRIGANFEMMQKLQIVNERAGNSSATFNMAMQRMTRRVSEAAKGTGEAVKALKEMGVDAKELAKLTPDEMFQRLAKAMDKIPAQGDKVRLAMKLFDSEGVALVNTMNNLEGELRMIEVRASDVKSVLSEKQADRFETLNDSAKELDATLKGVGASGALMWAEMKISSNQFMIDFLKFPDNIGRAWDGLWSKILTGQDQLQISKELDRELRIINAVKAEGIAAKEAEIVKGKFEKEKKITEEKKKQAEFIKFANTLIKSGATPLQKALDDLNKLNRLGAERKAGGPAFEKALVAAYKKVDLEFGARDKKKAAKFNEENKGIIGTANTLKRLLDKQLTPVEAFNKDMRDLAAATKLSIISTKEYVGIEKQLREQYTKTINKLAAEKQVEKLDKQIAEIDKKLKAGEAVGFGSIISKKVDVGTLALGGEKVAVKQLKVQRETLVETKKMVKKLNQPQAAVAS